MFYIQRDDKGLIAHVASQPFEQATEIVESATPEIELWQSRHAGMRSLAEQDLSMVRVQEDIIEALLSKAAFSITDLPSVAQEKLYSRMAARRALSDSVEPQGDDDSLLP
ncbi:tryptophan synthase subunit beta [Stutzerimonas kirkiae]|uniref:Tryptophan synthase subunit beta n=1 Tax=Stutzerimonas kirkiae TaxID=2211392 RepID=A0A4Q9R9P7_9GAMM|nr:tryptophan synthase subunit beta [Stutzerimonas kirkiae]TBU97397.1 tryptophan synthase subunit beta [Stutzerimonas kirkiae]TBV00373.1 tryptophan synthase subunit beta [Stutzerimonas kirkiae]TBV05502.1 tryptophan synthase subunit beta [Stutzerimonas kirkiae]TBV10552.1 tryptophan synthase subunit beta [Stutzerimonas kirkiae]